MIKVLFMGRKQVAADILRKLHADPRCELVGVLTDSHLADSATAEAARSLGVTILDHREVNDRAASGDLDFDLGLSILYWRKINKNLLDVARKGIVNFHPAPLPEYKGVGGYNLAILESRTDWAVTAHYVDEEIDTGEIIALENFAISAESETAQSLERSSMAHLKLLFDRLWEQLVEAPGRLPASINSGGRYLSREQLENLKRIDPEKDDVERKVRAFWFPPYDGAYLEFGGQRFTLVNRQILQDVAPASVSSLFSQPAAKKP